MIEGQGTSTVTFNTSAPADGKYVILITNVGEDITGTKLADIKKTRAYVGHKTFNIGQLTFYCQDVVYRQRPDNNYYIDAAIINSTPMNYDAALLIRLYRLTDQSTYTPLLFPQAPYLYTNFQLPSKSAGTATIPLPEALEPGQYAIELLIANDFKSHDLNAYFVFAAGPISIQDITAINNINPEPANAEAYYDIQGRPVSHPTCGIYIKNGKKIIIPN
ncbi:MAG: hypothetical protein J6Z14_04735 [Prevotella sp.]|nr:hypothetical protein [Prevotella sp.]